MGDTKMPSSNIVLRPLEIGDVAEVFALTSDCEVVEYMRFEAHTDPGQALELIREYIAPGNVGFAVLQQKDGRFCGVVSLHRSEDEAEHFDLSMFFEKRGWGQGYATAALCLLLREAEKVGIRGRIRANVVEKNLASRRVIEKCGFSMLEVRRFSGWAGGLCIYEFNNLLR